MFNLPTIPTDVLATAGHLTHILLYISAKPLTARVLSNDKSRARLYNFFRMAPHYLSTNPKVQKKNELIIHYEKGKREKRKKKQKNNSSITRLPASTKQAAGNVSYRTVQDNVELKLKLKRYLKPHLNLFFSYGVLGAISDPKLLSVCRAVVFVFYFVFLGNAMKCFFFFVGRKRDIRLVVLRPEANGDVLDHG